MQTFYLYAYRSWILKKRIALPFFFCFCLTYKDMTITRQDTDWLRIVEVMQRYVLFGVAIEKPVFNVEIKIGFFKKEWKKVSFGAFTPEPNGYSNFTHYSIIGSLYNECLERGLKRTKEQAGY